MKTIFKLAVAATLALSLAACESAPTKTLSDADKALVSANKANSKAKKLYIEWRDTGKILKKAKSAKKSGDFDKSVKLANKAERQAINAVKQYKAQKNVKPML